MYWSFTWTQAAEYRFIFFLRDYAVFAVYSTTIVMYNYHRRHYLLCSYLTVFIVYLCVVMNGEFATFGFICSLPKTFWKRIEWGGDSFIDLFCGEANEAVNGWYGCTPLIGSDKVYYWMSHSYLYISSSVYICMHNVYVYIHKSESLINLWLLIFMSVVHTPCVYMCSKRLNTIYLYICIYI